MLNSYSYNIKVNKSLILLSFSLVLNVLGFESLGNRVCQPLLEAEKCEEVWSANLEHKLIAPYNFAYPISSETSANKIIPEWLQSNIRFMKNHEFQVTLRLNQTFINNCSHFTLFQSVHAHLTFPQEEDHITLS